MANSSSEDETDTLPERPTRIQPYQFEPVRQGFGRERRAEAVSNRGPSAYHPNALPLGQTGSRMEVGGEGDYIPIATLSPPE